MNPSLFVRNNRGCGDEGNFQYILTVTDNGKGIHGEIEFQTADSMGLQLVSILAEQINVCIELKRNNGTGFVIRFNNLKEPVTHAHY